MLQGWPCAGSLCRSGRLKCQQKLGLSRCRWTRQRPGTRPPSGISPRRRMGAIGHFMGGALAPWDKSFPLESKAVCNPEHLWRAERCVVYSFGVGWDTTFEISMLRFAPHCKVRARPRRPKSAGSW